MDPTTYKNSKAQTFWNRLKYLAQTHQYVITEGSKHQPYWVGSHACSLPQNIYVIGDLIDSLYVLVVDPRLPNISFLNVQTII